MNISISCYFCIIAVYRTTDEEEEEEDIDIYYPGLVNISGTYCFLNFVLQAMSSLAYLQPHLEAIQAKAIELDVPTPVVDTLKDTLQSEYRFPCPTHSP